MLTCISLIFSQGCVYENKPKEESPITEVQFFNPGYGNYDFFYNTCVTVNQNGSIFDFTSTLDGLEDCSITFSKEQHENTEDTLYTGYYSSKWELFCEYILKHIAYKEPLSGDSDNEQYSYKVIFSDGTSHYYLDDPHDTLKVSDEYYRLFFDRTVIQPILDGVIKDAYEKKRAKIYEQLEVLDIQPLTSFTYSAKSSHGIGMDVIRFTWSSISYNYYLSGEASEHEMPEVFYEEHITREQWHELSNNKYLMLAYALAREKNIDNPEQTESNITFIASDGEFKIGSNADVFSFVLSERWIEDWLRETYSWQQNTRIQTEMDKAYAAWDYQFTYDNYDVSGMKPLEDLHSISLVIPSKMFDAITVDYYVDADLNFRITSANGLQTITTEGIITEQQWDDLIHSKGMLIAQQAEEVNRNPYIAGGIFQLNSKHASLLSSDDIGSERFETEYVILELEKLALECGLIKSHQRAIEEINTTINPELMKDENVINGWLYFLYPLKELGNPDVYRLYRRLEDGTELTRISEARCDEYTIIDDCVYFASFSYTGYEHGFLYVIRPDEEPLLLADEMCGYQIVYPHIYYAHSFDTIGVGIEGHALHRIDLDGGNHMIAAYETSGPGINSGHIGEIKDGYVYYSNIRIKLGEPADGSEEVQVIAPLDTDNDDGWLYYSTNKLYKARPDGIEQTVLAGAEDSWIYISKVDDKWIYYHEQWSSVYCKIRKDGSEKTEISGEEFYSY